MASWRLNIFRHQTANAVGRVAEPVRGISSRRWHRQVSARGWLNMSTNAQIHIVESLGERLIVCALSSHFHSERNLRSDIRGINGFGRSSPSGRSQGGHVRLSGAALRTTIEVAIDGCRPNFLRQTMIPSQSLATMSTMAEITRWLDLRSGPPLSLGHRRFDIGSWLDHKPESIGRGTSPCPEVRHKKRISF